MSYFKEDTKFEILFETFGMGINQSKYQNIGANIIIFDKYKL